MTQVRTMKVAAVSAMVGALLLLGAFLITSSMVSAQTPPEPTPSADEPATPRQTPGATPEDESEDESAGGGRSRADCPKEEGEGRAAPSSGASGAGGPRSFRQ